MTLRGVSLQMNIRYRKRHALLGVLDESVPLAADGGRNTINSSPTYLASGATAIFDLKLTRRLLKEASKYPVADWDAFFDVSDYGGHDWTSRLDLLKDAI